MNKPTVPLPTDEAGHTPHCGSEIPAAQRQGTTKRGAGLRTTYRRGSVVQFQSPQNSKKIVES